MKNLRFLLLALFLSFFMFIPGVMAGTNPPKYTSIIKIDSANSTLSDVYLKNPDTPQEKFFMTLSNVYRDHYHASEYHNGNLYIIRRFNEGQPNWTDELWRYNSKKEGQKIYSAQGLDFRVSDDETMVAVIDNYHSDNLILMRKNGQVIKKLTQAKDLLPATEVSPKNSPAYDLYLSFLSL